MNNCLSHVRKFISMGANTSGLEKEIGPDLFPANEHYFGLVNFGNTCYCNSVLQALYFCRPFREKVLDYKAKNKRTKETLLTCLADLFYNIATQKKKVGTIAPKKFIARLRKENELFDNYMQQDAHEFLNYLLNTIADILQAEKQQQQGNSKPKNGNYTNNDQHNQQSNSKPEPSWVHDIFQGTLTNETRCLNCETVSSKDEDFLDLSVDVDQNTSITHCLRGFSNTETLCSEHKYYCENCCSKQEAQKRMRIKKLPMILALHLKRFKYMEQLNRYTKLSYRVVFPLELRLFNTTTQPSTTVAASNSNPPKDQCTKTQSALAQTENETSTDSSSSQESLDRNHVTNDQDNQAVENLVRRLLPDCLSPTLPVTSHDAYNPDRLYDLVAVVIHCGSGPNRGHYISIVKSHGFWLLFDDDIVDKIEASAIEDFYGLTSDIQKTSESGYILFYQSRDCT